MVVFQLPGRFCDPGAPVVDGRGVLVALGAGWPPNDAGYLTHLVDASTVRATVQDWRGR
jgi:hypothetical protein